MSRKKDVLIAMNFDNNGLPFRVQTKNPGQFVVVVDTGRGKYPSFGVNRDGTFINNLLVDSNGKGLYRRAGKNVTHTTKLTQDILGGVLSPEGIRVYLEKTEVVNAPGYSVHNMIADQNGDVWVVEPGRGIISSPASASPFFVMTNFSLCDAMESGKIDGSGADRYAAATALLEQTGPDVGDAFRILEAVTQSGGEWVTDFSMVYSRKENAVYYCMHRDFGNMARHVFAS